MPKSDFRILLSNLMMVFMPPAKTLMKIAKELTNDIWVVAPEAEQSGAAHSITLSRPLRIRKVSAKRYSVDGTPTDCMAFGTHENYEGQKTNTYALGHSTRQ